MQLVPKAEDLQRKPQLTLDARSRMLLDRGNQEGYLTYRQLTDFLKANVFQIERDGPVKVLPDTCENRQRLNELLAILDQQDIALMDETEVIDFDREDPFAYFNRGNAWFEKEEYGKAMDDYQRATDYTEDGVSCPNTNGYTEELKIIDESD
jgi:tetratricopeptide (TPR) repeat protein